MRSTGGAARFISTTNHKSRRTKSDFVQLFFVHAAFGANDAWLSRSLVHLPRYFRDSYRLPDIPTHHLNNFTERVRVVDWSAAR